METVAVIIPALNEVETIGGVIDEVPRRELEAMGFGVVVTVVDNGSTDGTAEVAVSKGANLITELRRGKGRAVRTALERMDADYAFMVDADLTYPSAYIVPMLGVMQGFPVAMCSRLAGHCERGSMTRLNALGNGVLSWMANALYGSHCTDLCTGLWGFRRDAIRNLWLSADGFGLEANLFAQIVKRGYKIGELPMYYRRRDGTQPKLRAIKDGLVIAWTLIKHRMGRR